MTSRGIRISSNDGILNMHPTVHSNRCAFLLLPRVVQRAMLLLATTALLSMVGPSSGEEKTAPASMPSSLAAIDLRGEVCHITQRDDKKIAVLVFLTTECPLCRQYVPELNRIAAAVPDDRIAFFGVISDRSTTRTEARKFCDEFDIDFPVVFDSSGEIAAALEPTHVPEAFVIRPDGEVLYRGRINDLYADVNKKRNAARQHDLLDAVNAVVAGEKLATVRTTPVGCIFEKDAAPREVTYTRDIAPILHVQCAECHRPGEVAPFSLLSYEDAQKRSEWIAEVTSGRLMPPWKAEPNHGHFLGERRLTATQIALFQAWFDAGAPEGDPADLPPQPTFASGWRLGEPDIILQAPTSVTVAADGPDVFQHWVIPIDIPEDKMMVAFEFRPGNSAVVHHSVLLMDTMGAGRAKDAETPEPGYTTFGSIGIPVGGILGVWTPGMTPRPFPNDAGFAIPAGADLVMQLHLHPSGKEETDQSSVALYFADKPVKQTIARAPFVTGSILIDIPAGEKSHKVTTSVTLPADITLVSLLPHMHLLGREMKLTATLPDGSVEPLMWIRDWNFYWQDNYVYREPVFLPKGTQLDMVSYYDNSATNPFNPSDPPRRVLFGNDSDDEMCFGIFQFIAGTKEAESAIQRELVRSFIAQFNDSSIAPDAKGRIIEEAGKLFGGGNQSQLMRFLSPVGGGL